MAEGRAGKSKDETAVILGF